MQPAAIPTLRLRDIIGARNWRTAFFTTYSLSLSFFEAVVLHALRQAGVRTTSIAVDLDGYRSTLGERGAADAGRTYDLVPMLVPHSGIFHPKLMVLDGDAGPRVVIGSGNLTFRGWGGNTEVAEFLAPGDAPQAFLDVADFMDRLSAVARAPAGLSSERDPVPAGLAASLRSAGGTAGQGGQVLRVLHSLDRPISDQVVEAAEDLGGATTLLVVSPFLRLAAVRGLRTSWAARTCRFASPGARRSNSTSPRRGQPAWTQRLSQQIRSRTPTGRSMLKFSRYPVREGA